MTWHVVFSPGVEQDVAEATVWYEGKQPGLGHEFLFEVIQVWHSLADNPLLGARRHPVKNIRWRYPERFPYRIIYEVDEAAQTVFVIAVRHAARRDLT